MKRGKGEKLFTIHTYVVQLNICVNYSCIIVHAVLHGTKCLCKAHEALKYN